MKLSAKIFLEDNGCYILGPGRTELLRATESLGSLHKAAQAMGMSYRWAWGRLRDAEKALGVTLLTQEGKPGRGKPKILTQEAHSLLKWYDELEAKVQAAMIESAANCPDFLQMTVK